MAISIGLHTFSETDVRKTLHHAADVLDLHDATTARRERVAAALAGVDAVRDDVGVLVPVLTLVWPELLAARDDLVAAGALPQPGRGSVDRLSRSGGGVPKLPAATVNVGFRGVDGDRQASRAHHGRPWQALCLWSSEVIAGLAAAGHPIGPGAAGENATIGGLEWVDVRPGARLRIGQVLCQVSAYAVPCKQNARWFSDGDFRRIHHSNGPISRVYATVLEPGAIRIGDAVELEPS